MNEEKIILPAFVIADLYKNCLIEPQPEPVEKTIVQPGEKVKKEGANKQKQLQYLGSNKKNIIVLVYDPTAIHINDDELAFLTKVLNACNLTIADIAIINICNNTVLFDELINELHAEYILLLGVDPSNIKLPFTMPHFQVQQFAKSTILCAPPLSGLIADTNESVALKRQLWSSLQKIFKMK